MTEQQTILRKEEDIVYLSERADIDHHINVLGYKEIGIRTVEDGRVIDGKLTISEGTFRDIATYKTDMEVERPIWKDHEIVGYIRMSRIEADEHNAHPDATVYYGFTDEEKRLLNHGTEDELRAAGFYG